MNKLYLNFIFIYLGILTIRVNGDKNCLINGLEADSCTTNNYYFSNSERYQIDKDLNIPIGVKIHFAGDVIIGNNSVVTFNCKPNLGCNQIFSEKSIVMSAKYIVSNIDVSEMITVGEKTTFKSGATFTKPKELSRANQFEENLDLYYTNFTSPNGYLCEYNNLEESPSTLYFECRYLEPLFQPLDLNISFSRCNTPLDLTLLSQLQSFYSNKLYFNSYYNNTIDDNQLLGFYIRIYPSFTKFNFNTILNLVKKENLFKLCNLPESIQFNNWDYLISYPDPIYNPKTTPLPQNNIVIASLEPSTSNKLSISILLISLIVISIILI